MEYNSLRNFKQRMLPMISDVGTGNPNMKIVLVQHPGMETESLSIVKHQTLLALRSGTGIQNGAQIRTTRKNWGRYVKTQGPGIYIPRDKRSVFFPTCQVMNHLLDVPSPRQIIKSKCSEVHS